MNTKQRCEATNKTTNRQCKVTRLVDGTFCQYHSPDPKYILKRQENAIKGGQAVKLLSLSLKHFKLKEPEDLHRMLTEVLEKIAKGQIPMTAASLKILPSLTKEWRSLYSEIETESRLDQLEKSQKRLIPQI